VRWHWQRADGQMKDMACRELLRKLETRALIKLPPRQNYAPRCISVIEPVAQDPTLTCGACRNPLIRLTFRKITHHQQGDYMIFQNAIQTK